MENGKWGKILLALIVAFVAGLMPFAAYAMRPVPHVQMPLTIDDGLFINTTPAPGEDQYNLTISFRAPGYHPTMPHAPSVSSWPYPLEIFPLCYAHETGVGIQDGLGWRRYPDRYLVQFRNATAGHPWGAGEGNGVSPSVFGAPDPIIIASPGDRPQAWTHHTAPFDSTYANVRQQHGNTVNTGPLQTMTMSHSSAYEVRITPRRFVPTWIPHPTNENEWIPTWNPAPIYNRAALEHTALFMTDIEIFNVEATTAGLIVDFHYPTVDGAPLASEWTIAWQPSALPGAPALTHQTFRHDLPGGQNQGSIRISHAETIPITRDDYPRGGRRAIIPLASVAPAGSAVLIPGADIAVRVEPWVTHPITNHTRLLREPGPQSPLVSINNRFHTVFATNWLATLYISPRNQVSVQLEMSAFGGDSLRLHWSSLVGAGDVANVVLYEILEDGSRVPLASLLGAAAAQINEVIIPLPTPRRRMVFELMVYREPPTVPNRVGTPSNRQVFDPTFAMFFPYSPYVREIAAGHTGINGWIAHLEFLAFSREYFTVAERTAAELLAEQGFNINPPYVDRDITYRVYIANCTTLFGEPGINGGWNIGNEIPFVRELSATQLRLIQDPAEIDDENYSEPRYVWPDSPAMSLDRFYYRDGQAIASGAFRGNQTYFLMIYAVRLDENGVVIARSEPAFSQVFIPPFGPIETPPEMIAAPPLRVCPTRYPATCPHGGDCRGLMQREIPITWDLRYFEIQDPATERWHSVFGLNNGNLLFGPAAIHHETVNHTTVADFLRAITGANAAAAQQALLDLSTIDPTMAAETRELESRVSGILGLGLNVRVQALDTDNPRREFAVHVVPLAHLMATSTLAYPDNTLEQIYDEYMFRMLIERLSDDQGNYTGHTRARRDAWHRLNTTVPHAILRTVHAGGTTIQPNTTYVIFVLPIDIFLPGRQEGWDAFMPNFIIVTTPDYIEQVPPVPTVPILHAVHELTTRSSVVVRWALIGGVTDEAWPVPTGMRWQLHWSETWLDHPDASGGATSGGTLITWEEIMEKLRDPENLNSRIYDGYIFIEIPGLFVDTPHYIWGYAMQALPGTLTSAPSNPVAIRTLPLAPPAMPRSLMPATAGLLNTFNQQNDTEYSRDESDALTIIFRRIWADMYTGAERADSGTASGGTARALNLPEEAFPDMHMIRFEGLRANQRYYVRARTILTVTRDNPEGTYSYEVQVATNAQFLAPITFIIPPTTFVEESDRNARQAFSPWTTIEVETGQDDDAFDGVFRPDQFPMPERDWEVTYDAQTQTITWRMRSNLTGADGRPDQNADQRFISRLINSGAFVFTIDASEYTGRAFPTPVANRIIEIPLSIVNALHRHGVSLEIIAGEMSYIFPPGAFDTAAVRNLQMGVGSSSFVISIMGNPEGMPTLPPGTTFATVPQGLTVTAINGHRRVEMATFGRPVEVVLPMAAHTAPGGQVAGLFRVDNRTWGELPGNFSFVANATSSRVNTPGTFAGVRRTGATQITASPAQVVTAQQLNNVVYAIANGHSTWNMDAVVTPAMTQALQRGRLLAPANLTTEAALDILVRLYENRTRQVLTPMTPIDSVPGLAGASSELHRTLRIAADIGFITGPLNPQGEFTMAMLLNAIEIIQIDSGF
jgi:hypothetical protein